MFRNVLKALEKMKKGQVRIPINTDKDGYIDRECPNDQCLFQFKVHSEDWTNLFSDEVIYCPMCRHEANSTSWFTQQQIQEGQEQARNYILNQLDAGFKQDAIEFNRRQPKGLLSLRLKYTGSNTARIVLPIQAMEEMELKVTCKKCSSRYAVIGSAFFCPCCGHNSAEETFDFSLEKIRAKLNNLPIIQNAISTSSKDEAAVVVQNLTETCLLDIVVAFQRFCEVTFRNLAPQVNVTFNAFQKLDVGSRYWKENFGQGYEDWLSNDQMGELKIYFQKRHLLAHSEGFVDRMYIDRSGDDAYRIGQRIVVKENNVRDCLQLIEILSHQIKNLQRTQTSPV